MGGKMGWVIRILFAIAIIYLVIVKSGDLLRILQPSLVKLGGNTQEQNQMIPSELPAPASPHQEKIQAQKALLKQPWGRDPFSGSSAAEIGESASEDLVLTGIIQRSGKKVAIINRLFLREGDDVNGFIVMRIDPDKAFVKKGDQEIILRMGES